MNRYHFWVIGGDTRQAYLAGLLAKDGHAVSVFALEGGMQLAVGCAENPAPNGVDCVVLPMPVCRQDGLLFAPLCPNVYLPDEVFARCACARLICGGRVQDEVRQTAARHGLVLHDYFAREELAVRNAVPTAEGALALAMDALPVTIQDARILILGFGRVGQACALRFGALGAKICVAARRDAQLALARSFGFNAQPIDRLDEALAACELVINTVPAPILRTAELDALSPGAPVIDLASAPGGVDTEAAARRGIAVIPAPGLPGKVAPSSAGAYLRDTIYSLLREAGI